MTEFRINSRTQTCKSGEPASLSYPCHSATLPLCYSATPPLRHSATPPRLVLAVMLVPATLAPSQAGIWGKNSCLSEARVVHIRLLGIVHFRSVPSFVLQAAQRSIVSDVARWIRMMVLAGVLVLVVFLPTSFYSWSFSKTHTHHNHKIITFY